MLVARGPELERIGSLLEGLVQGRGGALLLHGEAGIGKTALLDRAREMATAETAVLSSRGIESESSLPFGALRDLVWPVVEGRAELPAPQRAALDGALALGPPVPGDRLAVCVATLGLLDRANAGGPVLAVVDDIQWLDGASRECVAYAARRAKGPVALLLAARDSDGLDYWDGIPDAALSALDSVAAAELLAGAAPDLAPGPRDAISAAADGNPLALVELPSTLTPEQRCGAVPLEHPLAPGRGLERMYSARLAALPAAVRAALLVAATCPSDELAPIGAACAAIGCSADFLQAAEAAGLVHLGAGRVTFDHPLVRGGVYHDSQPAERRAAHRALAEAVGGEARAWHLAAAAIGPDEVAAQALDQAGADAAARRAYAVAADAFERAARLSMDMEPSVARLLGAGGAALSAGQTVRAALLAEEASERAVEPHARAGAAHLRGVLALWGGHVVQARELLEHGADVAAETNPAMAALMLADASFAWSAAGDCRGSLALAERAARLLGDSPDPTLRAPVLAIYSWTLILCGETRRARPIVTEVLGLAGSLDPCSPAVQLVLTALNCRLPLEDYEGTMANGLELAGAAREAGSLYALPTPLLMAAHAAYRLGRWAGLDEMLGESLTAAEETDQWGPAAFAAVTRARLAAARGHESECRADAKTALALAESAGVTSLAVYGHGALGFLELSIGDVDAAIRSLELTERLVDETGLEEPTIIPWAPDLVEAYARAGRPDGARRVLATLSRQADLADTGGAAALAERCRGWLAQDFDEHFARALEHDDRGSMPFERARTLLAWGMRLHRARRRADARERLRAAAEVFEGLGAAPWTALARAELRAAGARRRTALDHQGLTVQEERIAQAAGRGATTREIATELFLSPKTVEFHLGHAYRKLGVHSRAELATTLAANGNPATRAGPVAQASSE